ncbi:MAG TPA: CHAT domain-containing tetratricopeptide repeat protein [Blastocatellia bacterium]|nr:CHAT domain-containing tetratricopeptide repeat protein [Blastocatellia bacterium]
MARTKRWSWPATVAVCLTLFAFVQREANHAASASAQSEDPALRAVVDLYFDVLAKEDIAAFKRLWSANAVSAARASELEQLFALDDYAYSNLGISEVKTSADRAGLRVAFDRTSKRTMILDRSSPSPRAQTERVTRNLTFVKESGQWKLARDASAIEDLALALVEAKTDSDRAALLEKESSLITIDLRQEMLEEATAFFVRQQHAEALNAYALAKVVAERANDKEGVAASLVGMGNIHRARREYAMAEEQYRKALAEFEALGSRDQVAGVLEYIGFVQHSAGKLSESVESYGKALAQYEAARDEPGRANSLENIGTVHYDRGDYASAVEAYAKSLKLYQRLKSALDVAGTLNNIGSAYYAQGDFVLALEHYRKALAGFEALSNERAIASTLNNIGGAHYSQGEYEQAIESYEKSFIIEERLGNTDGAAAALFGIALVHYARGDYARAIDYYKKSLALREALNDKAGIATVERNLGLVHYRQNDYAAALESYQKSLKLYEQMGKSADAAVVLNSIAGIYFTQGFFDAARDHYQKALAGFEAINDGAGAAGVLASLGNLYYSQSDHSAALDHYRKSLKQYEALGDRAGAAGAAGVVARIASVAYSEGRYHEAVETAGRAADQAKEIDDQDTLWRARATKGAALRNLNEIEGARAELEIAIAAIERMRARQVGHDQEPQRFFQDKSSPYTAMIDLLVAENRPEEALNYAERIKSHALLDVIESGRVRITSSMTAREQSRERMLINNVISLNAQVARERNRPRADQRRLTKLNGAFEKALYEYGGFKKRLYAAHPRLRAQRGEAPTLKFEEAGSLFTDSQTAMIEFVVTEARTYLFVLTKAEGGPSRVAAARHLTARADLRVYVLGVGRKQLAERASRLRETIEARDASFQQPAREMHDLLLSPAKEQLAGKAALVVVPDAALWQVPFHALAPADGRYLVEDYSVSYAPSLSALREMIKPRGRVRVRGAAVYDLIAFGNAESEAPALTQLYGERRSRILSGAQATKERFKAEGSRARVLHISTGGVFNDASPMYSHLIMGDGLLHAWEIVKLDLKAGVVVASTTEASRAQRGAGEGLTAMAWAFFVAGSQVFVTSDWRAELKSTSDLMLSFHQRLKSAPAAEALRQATLTLIQNEQHRHPFYWAGLRVMGGRNQIS